jgi:mannose-6-phosphate isomerase-like protein (cupin superfamily)
MMDAVRHFQHEAQDAALHSGRPLMDETRFKILVAEHGTPGEVEIHETDTDLIYCFEGEAEFVTGGTPLGMKTTAAHEQRGTSIRDGQSRIIKGGDILVVPAGVPHWFKTIQKHFRYSVVKIKTPPTALGHDR